jgi:hypothetical protein
MQSRIVNHVTVIFGISGCSFDGGEHEDCGLLGYNAVGGYTVCS